MSTQQPLFAHYVFHPVGQGLFASGMLYSPDKHHAINCPDYLWVYDCGTSTNENLVEREINNLLLNAPTDKEDMPIIDLLAISHFDTDHISGIVKLLNKFKVLRLILPYIPQWQRLVLAFEQEKPVGHQEIEFYIDPVSYLRRNGKGIVEIIFVPSSGVSISAPQEMDDILAVSPENGRWTPTLTEDNEKSDIWEGWEDETFGQDVAGIKRLAQGSSLALTGTWEFIPYNDTKLTPPPTAEKRQAFISDALALKNKLLDPNSTETERQSALNSLRSVYDYNFSQWSDHRNRISLYLYAGPIGKNTTSANTHSGDFWLNRYWSYFCCKSPSREACTCNQPSCQCKHTVNSWEALKDALGILYTGDAQLNTKAKLSRLIQYFQIPNTRRILCLQIMHHGSINNWNTCVEQTLTPRISVFSSEPNEQYRHPHPDVWKAFKHFGRRQVNSQCGLLICSRFK